jgi:small conductance mechanosensitive channel
VFDDIHDYLPPFSAAVFARIVAIALLAIVLYVIVRALTGRLRLLASLERDSGVRMQREQRAETLRGILNYTARVVLAIAALGMMLGELGIDITPVLAGAGLVGIAIGFGAQSLIRDFLSGFFIIFENQFGVGDSITVGGQTGVVERITFRTTVLRSVEGSIHIIPNGKIELVALHSRGWQRALVDLTVPYRQDLDRAIEVARAELARFAEDEAAVLLETPEFLGVDVLGVAGATLRMAIKTAPGQQAAAARELRRRLVAALDRADIELTAEPR